MNNDFMNKITKERASLEAWIRASVGEMDKIMDVGFPNVFGRDWRQKMGKFPVSARTKLLTYVFDYAIEEMAKRLKIQYSAANNQGASETNNFDCYLFGCEVENKLSLGSNNASFGTGSKHNIDGKVSRILAVKVKQSKDYHSEEMFAAVIDLSLATHKDSKWHIGKGKSGFSALKVSVHDEGIVIPLCGDTKLGKKYLLADNESIGRKP